MAKDDENAEGGEKIKFPYHVGFILGHELCERFTYNGVTALLTLYTARSLELGEDNAVIMYHGFVSLNTATCIVGAIISDVIFGRYHMILYGTLLYAIGVATIAIGSIETLHLPQTVFTIISLIVIATAMGGIKPCVSVFGGDQYKVPEQQSLLDKFFPMFGFAAQTGAFAALLITPSLRAHVRCYGELTCYPLGFGVPAVSLFIGFASFLAGGRFYTIRQPKNDVVILFIKAVFHAIGKKFKSTEKRDHWMDHADDKYDKGLIYDIKSVFRFVIVYIPVIIYWTLEGQYGSRWTLQAAHMNGEVGAFRILPEHTQMLGPILTLIFIPISVYGIYPIIHKIGIKRPLQKMVFGGVLTGIAYIASATLEFKMENHYPVLPSEGSAQLRIFNAEACDYDITTNIEGQEKFTLKALDVYIYKDIDVYNGKYNLALTITSTNAACPAVTPKPIEILDGTSHTIFLNSKNTTHPIIDFKDSVAKPKRGLPIARLVKNIKDGHTLVWKDDRDEINENPADFKLGGNMEFPIGVNKLYIDDKEILEYKMHMGGYYTIIINEKDDGSFEHQVHLMVEENEYHILWILPQYIILTLGGVIFQFTNLQFLYQEAPATMKGVIQAIGFVSGSLGNILVIIIVALRIPKKSMEFLFVALMMFIDMTFFALLGYRYKSYDPEEAAKEAAKK